MKITTGKSCDLAFGLAHLCFVCRIRRVWAPQEDEAIRVLVQRFGTKSWSVIADHIFTDYGVVGRSGKQCRERWHNHLGKAPNEKEIKTALILFYYEL